MKRKTYAVLGLGLFGSAVARTLAKEGHDVIAIDKLMEHVEEVSDVIEASLQGDFTKLEHLIEAGVGSADVAIVATSTRLEDTIMAILNLQKLNVPEIVVKSKNADYRNVLKKLGATRVVLPEAEMGARVAKELSDPTFGELIDLNHRYNIEVFPTLSDWVGKSLQQINLRSRLGINVIAIKSADQDEFNVQFNSDYILKEADELLGISINEFNQIIS